jgi:hypothetical protein
MGQYKGKPMWTADRSLSPIAVRQLCPKRALEPTRLEAEEGVSLP